MAVYPSAIITAGALPNKVNNVDPVIAEDINPVYAEIIAIENALGTLPTDWSPRGSFSSSVVSFGSLSERVGNLEAGLITRVVDTIGGTTIQPTAANSTAIPLVIKQYSSSNANLLEFKNSGGTVLNSVSKDGIIAVIDGGTA